MGDRLPTPTGLAEKTRSNDRQAVDVNLRGRTVQRLVCLHNVLWYVVNSATCSDWSLSTTRPGSNATASSSPPTCRPAVHRSRPPGRPLVHRDLPPRRQAGPWWRGPAVLETQRPRTRRMPIAMATQPDLVLVRRHSPDRRYVDPRAAVADQDDPQLPRRPRRAAPPSCGHNELQPCQSRLPATTESPRPCSTRSATPPEEPANCETPRPVGASIR